MSLLDVAKLVQICRKIESRKKLQKLVYILQQMGNPFHQQFEYLHYGPYSSDLKREIDQLVEAGLIQEESTQAHIFSQYNYGPTANLSDLLRNFGGEEKPSWAELATDLNRESPQTLEAISTILFLRQKGFGEDRLRARFCELKPALSADFEKAKHRADELIPLVTSRTS